MSLIKHSAALSFHSEVQGSQTHIQMTKLSKAPQEQNVILRSDLQPGSLRSLL